MDLLRGMIHDIAQDPQRFEDALWVHVRLSASALILAMAIFIPLGVVVARSGVIGPGIVGAVTALRVVPSLAILFLLIDYVGTGYATALVALTALAGPPLIINTDAGLRNVDAAVIESARGLGMNRLQVFARVQFPLALPVVIAGVRSAAVEVIASATLAAFIGVGGLGQFITSGLTLLDYKRMMVGAVPVTLLALFAESALAGLERLVAPPAA